MKKTLTILIALLLADFSIAEGLYEQLCTFNPNWKKYEKQVGDFPAGDFRSDRLYIRAHLGQVLKILDGNSISGLSEDQLSTRKRLIGLLEDYRLEGNFPKNYYRRERIPVFIDEHGTHCAVGYLMMQSGKEEMAQRISARNNYVWVKDLVDEELAGWQLSSGFTFEELKLIQGAYDSYMDGALEVAYRYEIPQKPEVMTHYFGEKELSRRDKKKVDRSEKNLWCRGEGEKGVLNGKWVQNYAAGMPWIVGYYETGKRTGQWEEYYRGTKKLCRTEHWENDKLNGIRKRFDRKGKVIEEIFFVEGKAIRKTNYDDNGMRFVRTPIDSLMVQTEIYADSLLIGFGKERIHNQGNLQWFQNIELTALNSFSLSSQKNPSALSGGNNYQGVDLSGITKLVEYRKEGLWTYYPGVEKLFSVIYASDPRLIFGYGAISNSEVNNDNTENYREGLHNVLQYVPACVAGQSFRINFSDNEAKDIYCISEGREKHLRIYYQAVLNVLYYRYGIADSLVSEIGEVDSKGRRIGEWKHYNSSGILYKTENYLIPWLEQEQFARQTNTPE